MSTENPYYVHSGKCPVLSVFLMLIFGAFAAAILSVVYGYAIAYIPFIYLNFFITLFFGVLVGVVVGIGGKKGKSRNQAVYGLIGLLIGVFALYLSWVVWFYASSGQKLLLINANELWISMRLIATTGAWSIFGWTPTGGALYFIWIVEALMIVGGCTLMAFASVESVPFCETCSQWVENSKTKSGLESIEEQADFNLKLEQGQFGVLNELSQAESNSNSSTEVEIKKCNSCEGSNYLSVSSVKTKVDEKGKESKDSTKLINNLKLTSQQYSDIASSF